MAKKYLKRLILGLAFYKIAVGRIRKGIKKEPVKRYEYCL